MSFVKRNYIDGETVITAENLNDIQDAIIQIVPDDVKQALLQIASKVAYIDEHGQDYYDALESALYPDASLVSISAVYTQSGTVYDTDSLDSLKADLVVTATYDDSSTATVTTYTLSGTLEVGTSTITVAYGGKTATFNVTVTAEPSALYPMPNGEHAFTGSEYTNRSITVTNHNHVIFSNPSATSSTTTASYCIFDDVSDNGASANTANINAPSIPLFVLPANASVEFVIDNITVSKAGSIAQYTKFAMALRSGSSSIVTTGDLTTETSKTVTQTISEAKDITCLFIFAGAQFKTIEFDVHLTVNGEVWI